MAEGISYINEVTYIEQTEMDEKGYRSSQLLNYLDFSLDLHLGDIFGEKLDEVWLGYGIHHRSAIFESSSRLVVLRVEVITIVHIFNGIFSILIKPYKI